VTDFSKDAAGDFRDAPPEGKSSKEHATRDY